SGDLSLVVHLKLAGQMVHITADGQELAHGGHPVPMWGTPLPHKSSHVVFHLDNGSTLYLTDIRQFARLTLLPDTQVSAFLKKQKAGAGAADAAVPRRGAAPEAAAAEHSAQDDDHGPVGRRWHRQHLRR